MNKLVSVMMPAKNEEKYIASAIDSIINQTYKEWELLIIDDCSIDKTRSIAEDYQKKDKRIRVLQGDGICSGNARNKAIDAALGYYIMNMDADDVSVPERIERLVAIASCYSASVIGSDFAYVDTQLQVKKVSNLPKTNDAIRAGFARVINRDTILPGAVLISAPLIRKYRYNEFYKILVDWDLILRIGEDKSVHFENVKEPLYLYRLNEGSMTFNYITRARYNILLRYNEMMRKQGKAEITSLEYFDQIINKNVMNKIFYSLFFMLKKIQYRNLMVKHRAMVS